MEDFIFKKTAVKEKPEKDMYILDLFIAGTTPNSARAIVNIKKICSLYLPGRFTLNVIDIYQRPERLIREQITAVPVLIKKLPSPETRMIGDLSSTKMVLEGLGLKEE